MSSEMNMHWTDHLMELRRRVVRTIWVWVLGVVIGFWFAGDIIQWIKRSVPGSDMTWNAFSPWDGVGLYMKVTMIISIAFTIPFAIYQVWSFVSPGLQVHEQRAALRYVPFSVFLLACGMLFGYYVVFPLALAFTSAVTQALGLQETYGIMHYVDFLLNIVIPITLLFELPVVIMFLTRLRIVNPELLRKMRRISYFILIFISVVITPPDFISDILVAIPMIFLYELSVWLSVGVARKQAQEAQQFEAQTE